MEIKGRNLSMAVRKTTSSFQLVTENKSLSIKVTSGNTHHVYTNSNPVRPFGCGGGGGGGGGGGLSLSM